MQVFRNAPARAFLAETAGKLATPGFMGPFAATLGYLVGQDEALGPSLVVGTLAGVLLQLIHSLWTSSPGGRDPDPADGPP